MLCGVAQEKALSVEAPVSPASTAGNSSSHISDSSIISTLHLLADVANDVLLLTASTWHSSVESSEDIARLCRSVSVAQEVFMNIKVSKEAIVAWRIFQGCDHNYNGYVTRSEIRKLLVSFHPGLGLRDQTDEPANNLPMVFWDVLSWWRQVDLSDSERRTIEHYVLKRLIVPSDGLWAGLGVNALLRVWKTVCRSSGCLFRYEADRYLRSTFLALRSVPSELELVLLLIRESVDKLGNRAGAAWRAFIDFDDDDDGKLSDEQLRTLLKTQRLKCVPVSALPISRSTSGSSSLFVDDEDCGENLFSFIQVLDGMVETGEINVNFSRLKSVRLLPGQHQVTNSFSDRMSEFWRTLQRKKKQPIIPISRLSQDPLLMARALPVYVKTYLDVEQWRGHRCTDLGSITAATEL